MIVSSGPPKTEPPVASFTYLPEEIHVGEPVEFDGTGSSDPDGEIVKWYWEFGPGPDANAEGETATYTFESVGTYTVTLWVTDDTGLVSSLPLEIEVKP
jgi:chitinase